MIGMLKQASIDKTGASSAVPGFLGAAGGALAGEQAGKSLGEGAARALVDSTNMNRRHEGVLRMGRGLGAIGGLLAGAGAGGRAGSAVSKSLTTPEDYYDRNDEEGSAQ